MEAMTGPERTRWVTEQARQAGFDLCGVAPVEGLGELDRLPEWLAAGYAGEMKYLHDQRRGDPRRALEGARSLIVVALNYNTAFAARQEQLADVPAGEPPCGWISRYAWGDDYHQAMRDRLNAIVAAMRAQFPEPFEAAASADTGPILERVAAKYAGLGWLAKNTFLINQKLGSWTFLGVIVTTLEFAPTVEQGEPLPRDLCGSCTRCLDACPTDAFPEPYVLDSRKCISYLTIELRGSIPVELREGVGSAVIGCDICQDVCPWNRKAPVTALAAFQPREFPATLGDRAASPKSFLAPDLEWLASLSQQEFGTLFRDNAAKRAKWRGLVRNACVALGNARMEKASPAYVRVRSLLERLAGSEDALIAEHARWALERQRSAAQPAQ
jgi:epoxyqueuosine reductase